MINNNRTQSERRTVPGKVLIQMNSNDAVK